MPKITIDNKEIEFENILEKERNLRKTQILKYRLTMKKI